MEALGGLTVAGAPLCVLRDGHRTWCDRPRPAIDTEGPDAERFLVGVEYAIRNAEPGEVCRACVQSVMVGLCRVRAPRDVLDEAPDTERPPPRLGEVADLLGLVIEGSPPNLSPLSGVQLLEVSDWAELCHLEASDNDVKAGPAPACLRALLPDDHYLRAWRMPPGGAS